MYGAGSIGRGYIAELFYDSGLDVIFIDKNCELMNQIKRAGEYPLTFVSNNSSHEKIIKNVTGICSDDDREVCCAFSECDIAATSVGKTVLPKI